MKRIKKFNESLSEDSLHIEISRKEYDIIAHFLKSCQYELDNTGEASYRLNRKFSEDDHVEIRKFLSEKGQQISPKNLEEQDYLNYITIRMEEEFKENNID